MPPNINSDNVIGQLKWRNLLEAAFIAFSLGFIAVNLSFIPIIPRLIGFVLVALPLILVAAVGINEEPLSLFLLSFFTFRSTRCVVRLRMPMPHIMTDQERKALAKEERQKAMEAKKAQLEQTKEKAKDAFSLFRKKEKNDEQ